MPKSDDPELWLFAAVFPPREKGEGFELGLEPAAEEPKVNFGGSDMAPRCLALVLRSDRGLVSIRIGYLH